MAWRNLLNRRIQTLITIGVVAVGLAVTLAILILSSGIKQGIVRASEPFGMIVGSKGSANQLVFNTIFLMDSPLGNLEQAYYDRLSEDPRVAQAVPFALGDNYKGFRIVGTDPSFFELRGRPADPPYFRLSEGKLFGQAFEAVLGADVAQETGLKIGDRFASAHGVVAAAEPEEHLDHSYTVVGILRSVSAPSDKGIFVSMDSYWVSHEHHDEAEAGGIGHEEEDEGIRGVTAAMVKPNSYIDLMKLYQEINQGKDAQAVFPGQTIAKIFDMMGSGEAVLRDIGYVVLGMAGFTVALSLYGSSIERRRTVAILRAIGAGRRAVMAIVLLESVLIMILGCAIGVAGGYALAGVLAGYMSQQVSIAVPVGFDREWLIFIGMVGLVGTAAGLFPALGAYRTESARYLNAS
ncbi:FtsX-like permease family protein [Cohnella terricola]|uniref:Putative hemin transport system permease protein HrtB n=2 Tax=Cohnella terricola TaxID=1289167 RepID=A0A559JBB1_9BACL|nr:FtsX-like permease family protein [Cohnella terricola]